MQAVRERAELWVGEDVEVVEAEGEGARKARGGDVGRGEENSVAVFFAPAYVADNR